MDWTDGWQRLVTSTAVLHWCGKRERVCRWSLLHSPFWERVNSESSKTESLLASLLRLRTTHNTLPCIPPPNPSQSTHLARSITRIVIRLRLPSSKAKAQLLHRAPFFPLTWVLTILSCRLHRFAGSCRRDATRQPSPFSFLTKHNHHTHSLSHV